MNNLFALAENEMKDLKHPYVGTEHFMLAYLKEYGNKYITGYMNLKEEVKW